MPETGLRVAFWRKRPQSLHLAFRRPFLRSGFRAKTREIAAISRDFSEQCWQVSLQSRMNGGGRGIRTPGTLSGTSVFKYTRGFCFVWKILYSTRFFNGLQIAQVEPLWPNLHRFDPRTTTVRSEEHTSELQSLR